MVKDFILQWHLSEACNLKCKHCYQENHVPIQLDLSNLLKILDQYKEFLKKLKLHGHINLTGGEPLCSPYFFNILDEFKKNKDLFSFSILTNGTLITEKVAQKISNYHPSYVQISLEGGKSKNDYIRGKGAYKRIGKSIDILKKFNVFVSISFTATRKNYKEFPKVVRFAEKHHADTVWSDRFIPLGTPYDSDFSMTPKTTDEYLKIMQAERLKLINRNSSTHVNMYRALQFLETHDFPYCCSAGTSLLTVMENGDLVPCRRMPIVVGNILKDNMLDIYQNNLILKDLQNQAIPQECESCEHSELCRGGLKCLSYATTGNYLNKDPGCTCHD